METRPVIVALRIAAMITMQFKRDADGTRHITTRFSAAVYKRLLPFLDAADKTGDKYFRFTSSGFEPLVVENREESFIGYLKRQT